MTIDHEEECQIETGTVVGRLHIPKIPTAGSIEEGVIDPEQYVT